MEHSFAAAIAALLLAVIITAGFFALEKIVAPEGKEEPVPKEISVSKEPEEEKVVLGIFEEKLALFAGKSPYPNIVYDFFVRNLPPEDRKRLSEGITVSSQSELDSLLEDFMS